FTDCLRLHSGPLPGGRWSSPHLFGLSVPPPLDDMVCGHGSLIPLCGLALLPSTWVIAHAHVRGRSIAGLCPACGYDLRLRTAAPPFPATTRCVLFARPRCCYTPPRRAPTIG